MKDAEGKSMVLRFYNTAAGELVCRVTDAFTHESWMATDAMGLLREVQTQRREPAQALSEKPPR